MATIALDVKFGVDQTISQLVVKENPAWGILTTRAPMIFSVAILTRSRHLRNVTINTTR